MGPWGSGKDFTTFTTDWLDYLRVVCVVVRTRWSLSCGRGSMSWRWRTPTSCGCVTSVTTRRSKSWPRSSFRTWNSLKPRSPYVNHHSSRIRFLRFFSKSKKRDFLRFLECYVKNVKNVESVVQVFTFVLSILKLLTDTFTVIFTFFAMFRTFSRTMSTIANTACTETTVFATNRFFFVTVSDKTALRNLSSKKVKSELQNMFGFS